MAHNVQKYIEIEGPANDMACIYRCAVNIIDSWITYNPETPLESPSHAELGVLVEMMGGDPIVINGHGWSSIESVYFNADNSMCIQCITPYGNLSELMEWFRKRFPACRFRATNDDDEENEWD